jgi:8-oxo-dGTP pyrophosphatase MutT (NUDIX family)
MKQAGVMLIVKDGLILGISRRDDKTKFGLPGGKVDDGEMPWQAAIRETLEETDITVSSCVEIFCREEPPGPGPNGEAFYAYCYYALAWTGEPKDSEEGVVKWLTAADLTGEAGAFAVYNRKTLDTFKLKYPHIQLKGE